MVALLNLVEFIVKIRVLARLFAYEHGVGVRVTLHRDVIVNVVRFLALG